MRMSRLSGLAILVAALGFAMPALSRDRVLSFSLTGGASFAPDYFGSRDSSLGPWGSFGSAGIRFGDLEIGATDGPVQFQPGAGLRGAFRLIGKREGKDELDGLDNVRRAVEVGVGAHFTEENWQVFSNLRYGAIGHSAFAGDVGANVIFRGENGLVLNAGPRAQFGASRFMRTYFGVTEDESVASGLDAFRPSSGFYSVGVEAGAFQPINDDWGITGRLRFDRLTGDASNSPIVQQGTRNQFSAQIGLTRHFNFRF
ncbi:MAG: MipA/OmpV family protein [Roseinatronobacter sp.]